MLSTARVACLELEVKFRGSLAQQQPGMQAHGCLWTMKDAVQPLACVSRRARSRVLLGNLPAHTPLVLAMAGGLCLQAVCCAGVG